MGGSGELHKAHLLAFLIIINDGYRPSIPYVSHFSLLISYLSLRFSPSSRTRRGTNTAPSPPSPHPARPGGRSHLCRRPTPTYLDRTPPPPPSPGSDGTLAASAPPQFFSPSPLASEPPRAPSVAGYRGKPPNLKP